MLDVTAQPDRFTVDDYFKLYENGLLLNNRVELIEGRIRKLHAQGNDHRAAMTRGSIVFHRYFPANTHWVSLGGTVRLSRFSAPDPDISVFSVPVGTPDAHLPLPFLVVEISDSSYRKDIGSKLRLYAKSGIQDYWVVHLKKKRIEVNRAPENPTGTKKGWRYAIVEHFVAGDSVSLLARPDVSIAVGDMVP